MGAVGGLGFAKLIKTFIPGLLLAAIAAMYVDISCWLARGERPVLELLGDNGGVVLGVAVPASLLAGIFSNMVVFTWLTDSYIREPFGQEHPRLISAEKSLVLILLSRVNEQLESPDVDVPADLDYLGMPYVELPKWIYLQESYWYYLEFQMNTMVALALSLPGAVFLAVRGTMFLELGAVAAPAAGVGVGVGVFLACRFCLTTSRANYERHMRKRLNYILSGMALSGIRGAGG